jgi:hypothetical protein
MFKGPAAFSLFIEQEVLKKRTNHLEAVLNYCKENYLDPEDIKHLVNKSLRDKIEVDLIKENLLPKRATLDIGE